MIPLDTDKYASIDTTFVSNCQGRLEKLRLLRAAFDCLPEKIAVLNEHANIELANRAWVEFGRSKGIVAGAHWHGIDYLAVCHDSDGGWVEGDRDVREGLRAILAGEKDQFEVEYPSYSYGEQRWSRLRANGFDYAGVRLVLVAYTNTTGVKRASRTLGFSNGYYRAMVDNAPFGVMNHTLDGEVLYANQALARMLEFDSVEEIFTEGILSRWLDAQRRDAFLSQLKLHGHVDSYEYEVDVVTGKGNTIHALIFATVNGSTISSMVMDISARKQAEEALRQSGKKLRKVQQMVQLGHCEWDIRNNKITWSDEIYRIFGIDRETLLTYETLMQVIHPEDREYLVEHTAKWLMNRGGEPFEFRIIRPDGTTRFIYATEVVEYSEIGEPIKFDGVVQDVTESKLHERAGQESEQCFRATFEQATIGLAHVTPTGRFLRINQKFCDLLGYSQVEMLQMCLEDLTHGDDLATDLEHMRRLQSGEIANYTMETRYYHKNGEPVWLNLTVSQVKEDTEQPPWLLAVAQNLSDRKRAEKEIVNLIHNIGLRLKELNCMFTISNSIRTSESLNEIFQATVNAIPHGWSYPKITRVMLRYNGREWMSEPFTETDWKLSSNITVGGEVCGAVDVYYIEECSTLDEGPFMKEERRLIDSISLMLSETLDRRKSQTKLRESEQKFRMLVANIPDVTWTADREGNATFVSDNIYGIYGYNPEEIYVTPQQLWHDRIHPDDIDGVMHAYVAFFQTHDRFDIEYRIETKDGQWVWIHDRSIAIYQKGGISYADGVLTDVTASKHAERKVFDYQRRLKSLAHELTRTEERERRNIAADLHDHVGQSLAAMRMQLQSAQAESNGRKVSAVLDEVSDSLSQVIRDTRDIMSDLSSSTLNESGLSSAIAEWLEEKIGTRYSLETCFDDDGQSKPLDEDTNAILFRSVRELLMNVIKHAKAGRVTVSIQRVRDTIKITIEDDGVGMDTKAAHGHSNDESGFGLFSIEERMKDLGGSLTLESSPGHGVRAILTIPLEVE